MIIFLESAVIQVGIMSAFKKFLLIFSIVFFLHLIFVLSITFRLAGYAALGGLFLFLFLDFPLSYLYFLVEPLSLKFSSQILFDAIVYQIIGTTNWLLIVYVIRSGKASLMILPVAEKMRHKKPEPRQLWSGYSGSTAR